MREDRLAPFRLRAARVTIDLLILTLAYLLGFALRFDWEMTYASFRHFVITAPYVVGLQYAALEIVRVPKFSWRFVGLHEVRWILLGLGAATGVLLCIRLVAGELIELAGLWRFAAIPIGVILINFAMATLGLVGARTLLRIQTERRGSHRIKRADQAKRTLLIGAGRAGHTIAQEFSSRTKNILEPVGFIDDDPRKLGMLVRGIKVLGTTNDIAEIANKTGAEQALITLASAHGEDVRRIVSLCNEAGIATKTIPTLHEIASGHVPISQIRDVAIEDLLRRDQVRLDNEQWFGIARNKVVLVTGAGGSIGSELCRQLLHARPKRLISLEQAENSLFWIHRELLERAGSTELVPCIADVCDQERIREVFATHRPSAIFHAAAHKHVPMMESNPSEAIKNNVGGTRVVADWAHEFKADHFVMISTDKAVNPTSVMGATKRIAELYVQALAHTSDTSMVCVRFGNVLGSAGSVIPTFREQIKRGGPVTVTDPEMQRYFMTIPEACQLVLQAGGIGEGGEIFVLDMGQPVKIVDLATEMIRLSGLRPNFDIEIRYTGLRPGEKLFEELAVDGEENLPTRCPKVFIWKSIARSLRDVRRQVTELLRSVPSLGSKSIRERIMQIVPEYTPMKREPVKRSVVEFATDGSKSRSKSA